jgi:1-acyl-sn-glycerol-3-phosphate acyltransferase
MFYKYVIRWTLAGPHPNDVKRKVLIAVPHTSGWDLPLGLLVKYQINLDVKFVGKKSLFKWPFDKFFRMWGLLPIDRTKGTSVVDEIVELYRQGKINTIGLAPEGTRNRVEKFKTGFYRIAKAVDIPVIMVKFDYAAKQVSFSDPYYLRKTKEEDISFIESHFRGTIGKISEFSFV